VTAEAEEPLRGNHCGGEASRIRSPVLISPVSLAPPPTKVDLGPLAELVAKLAPGAPFHYEAMTGGASTRRYFRLFLPQGTTAVAMFVPEGARPEEVQKLIERPEWPFLEVRALLAARGVDVPNVLAEDTARGWLVIEDLGEDTLANFLLRSPEDKTALYTRAVSDLARAQVALGALPPESVVAGRAFDEELLRWEIDHFREWGLDARGHTLPPEDRAAFDAIADRLARRIAGWPRTFVHRDYQSRNLMVRPSGAICWIDFQDALMGPRVYDLVALLNDSYQEFDRPFVDARLDEFARAASLSEGERALLGREFDYVTVQRKLKDAGRFVFIDQVKHNPSFLRFVTPTIRKVHGALGRLADDEDMRTLAALLRRALPDDPDGEELLGVGTP
jgi:aminoglycoside/choline kinase family phosphotransferase